jgi:hypothetical protein
MTDTPNTDQLDLDAIEAATRHALESMSPGHLVSAALHALALLAEVRKLREALAEADAVCEPILKQLTSDDVMVFRGQVPRPGYPREKSTESLRAVGLLKDFATNTPLGNLFQSYLNRQHSGAGQALGDPS